MTSAEIAQQMNTMGSEAPDFQTQITQAYEKPVLQPLVQERAGLEAGYLPAIFEPFTQTGTSAADMSPAAKLAGIGGSLGRLSSRIGANQDIQNFYGAQIDNLARNETNKWQTKYSMLKDQYQMAKEREAAAAAARARARQMAQMAQMYSGGGGGGAVMSSGSRSPSVNPITIGTDRGFKYSPGVGGLAERGAKGFGDIMVGLAGGSQANKNNLARRLTLEGLITGSQRDAAAAARANTQRLQAGVSDSLVRQYGIDGANEITRYSRARGLSLPVAMRELAAQGAI